MALSLKARRRVALLLVLLLPVAAVVLYSFPPTETAWYPKCVLYSRTGIHCPGCGTARCLHALSRGQILQAMAFNVLTVACVPFLAVCLTASAAGGVLPGAARRFGRHALAAQRVAGGLLVLLGLLLAGGRPGWAALVPVSG